ncbi:unnamed protein product [Pleuronectes platessa]|uniref:Uncharacterized protein n=1 Tax=Pleuronectes platessa TaxID=8262 RepID=A0A9N7VWQ5_PLEPL|nr:unnamed protein product [Pleuronectes platessa]
MASACLYALLTTSRHGPYGVLGDLLLDLDPGLSALLDSLKCCRILGFEHRSCYMASGPHATLMESISDGLDRNMRASRLLEVIMKGSDSVVTLDACRALLADHLSYGARWGNPPFARGGPLRRCASAGA